jgi:hypothetical protein
VLDDFHLITDPLLYQAMDLLIEAQPPQMRLVLLPREDPGIQAGPPPGALAAGRNSPGGSGFYDGRGC